MYKIGVFGAACTGKSTYCYKLAHELKMAGESVGLLVELARLCPHKLGTVLGQEWLVSAQMKKENELCIGHEVIITDRTTLDPVVYCMLCDKYMSSAIENVAIEYLKSYDKLIYAVPFGKYKTQIEEDCFRKSDIFDRKREINKFDEMVKLHKKDLNIVEMQLDGTEEKFEIIYTKK